MDKRKIRQGAYATAISVIAVIIVLFVNLIVGELNIQVDLTSDKKYSLSEQTKELAKGLDTKITVYYLVQSGKEIPEFQKIVDNYGKLSDNVSVVYKDPVQYPKFLSQYSDETVTSQGFLVVNEDTQKGEYISSQDAIDYTYDNSTGQYSASQIILESKIDAAIQVVTNEKLPKVYAVDGHGETAISTYMGTLLTDGNVTHDTLSTLTTESIPEDCDMLYICQPQYDFTENETAMILDYLKNNGKAIISVDYVSNTLPNFMSILNYYGIDVADGYVIEANSNYYSGNYASELVPKIYVTDFTNGIKGKKYIVSNVSSGLIEMEDKRDTVTISPILKTSDDAYSKVNLNSTTVSKEKGDIDGPFLIGASITENETQIAVYSGKFLWDDNYLQYSSFGNADLLTNTINCMSGQKNVLSIQGLSLSEEFLNMTQAQKSKTGVVVLGIIPLAFLAAGIFVVLSRRRR